MLDGHLEGILACDRFAHPLGDLGVLALADVIQLHEDVHHQLVLFFLGHRRAGLPFSLGQRIHLSLHTIDFECTGHVGFDLRLVDLTEYVQILPVVLLMRIKPVERETAILIERQWVVELLETDV